MHPAAVGLEREQPPVIESILVNRLAFLPEAGKKLPAPTVQVRLWTNEIVDAETMSCTLTYRGKALPRAGDGWLIPKDYRTKRLLLSVTATYNGATRTISLPVTPR